MHDHDKTKDKQERIRRTELAIEHYSQMVNGIALTRLKYVSDAEDVYQEVFFTYFEKAGVFVGEEHEKAWLIRTTLNLCKRMNFSPWRLRTVPLEEAERTLELSTEEETRVFAELRSLNPKYKIPLYLHYFENMPADLIADVLGIKPDAVRKQLQRGRELLKKRLESDYFE